MQFELLKSNQYKAPGYDFITGQVLKKLPKKAIVMLTTIYNCMISILYYPLIWKYAHIIMVPKPGKALENVTSYRPISLLPLLSKVFEKLLLKRILEDTDITTQLPPHQFGFREGHSTVQQTHRIINQISKSLEEKKYCTAVFLDVTQAFDKVWHTGLLCKLKRLLPSYYFLLLKSYISDRYFSVKYNNEISKCYPIQSGVPQGSVLGPLLYLIYTADLPEAENTVIATFADDTAIMSTHEDPAIASVNLQHHLNLMNEWLDKWRIKINPTKSAQVTFTLRTSVCPTVTINNVPVPVKTETKYLGLHLDQRLTWKKHIQTKRQQMNLKFREMYWLLGRTSKLSLSNKLLLYKTMLKPIWTYGIQLWGCAKPTRIKTIQQFQSKTLRALVNAPWYVTNQTIHEDLGISFVIDEIHRFAQIYQVKLQGHSNELVQQLTNAHLPIRRLRRTWPCDL
jgi:hypothetical protein